MFLIFIEFGILSPFFLNCKKGFFSCGFKYFLVLVIIIRILQKITACNKLFFGNFCPNHSKQIKSKLHRVHICRLQKISISCSDKNFSLMKLFLSMLKFKSHVLQHRKKVLWLGTAGIGRLLTFYVL